MLSLFCCVIAREERCCWAHQRRTASPKDATRRTKQRLDVRTVEARVDRVLARWMDWPPSAGRTGW